MFSTYFFVASSLSTPSPPDRVSKFVGNRAPLTLPSTSSLRSNPSQRKITVRQEPQFRGSRRTCASHKKTNTTRKRTPNTLQLACFFQPSMIPLVQSVAHRHKNKKTRSNTTLSRQAIVTFPVLGIASSCCWTRPSWNGPGTEPTK